MASLSCKLMKYLRFIVKKPMLQVQQMHIELQKAHSCFQRDLI